MAQGKYLFPDRRKELLGLSGFFTATQSEVFRDNDINETFEIAHSAVPQNIALVNGVLGVVSSTVAGLSTAGLATIAATSATGIGLIVVAVAAAVLTVLNMFGVFDSCRKAAYDQAETQRQFERMSDVINPHFTNIANQQSTSILQDNNVAAEIQNTFRILAIFQSNYHKEASKDWKSSCSKDNTKHLKNFIDKILENFLSKVRALKDIYDVELWQEDVDFSSYPSLVTECKLDDPAYIGVWKCWNVSLERKKGDEETLIFFMDFLRADLPTPEVLLKYWNAPTLRDELRQKGKTINQQWKLKGCIETVVNGVQVCEKFNYDDDTRERIGNGEIKVVPTQPTPPETEQPKTEQPTQPTPEPPKNQTIAKDELEGLKKVFADYWNSKNTLNDVISAISKYNDAVVFDAMKLSVGLGNGFSYFWFSSKKDLMCYYKNNREKLFGSLKEEATKNPNYAKNPTAGEKAINYECAKVETTPKTPVTPQTPNTGNNQSGQTEQPKADVPKTPVVEVKDDEKQTKTISKNGFLWGGLGLLALMFLFKKDDKNKTVAK